MSNLSWPPCDKNDFEEKFCCSCCGEYIVNDHDAFLEDFKYDRAEIKCLKCKKKVGFLIL